MIDERRRQEGELHKIIDTFTYMLGIGLTWEGI
jgi:hypothetical protein